jgi:hypothetical protein
VEKNQRETKKRCNANERKHATVQAPKTVLTKGGIKEFGAVT